jgi:hypothetical protein
MHIRNQCRLRLVQRLKAAVDEDTFAVEHRPHGAVAHEHTFI